MISTQNLHFSTQILIRSDRGVQSTAYLHKQATIQMRMANHCATHWLPVLLKHGIMPSWKSDFAILPPQLAQIKIPAQTNSKNIDRSDTDENGNESDEDENKSKLNEDENKSKLDEDEDILASCAFDDD